MILKKMQEVIAVFFQFNRGSIKIKLMLGKVLFFEKLNIRLTPLLISVISVQSLSVRILIENSECQPHQPAARSESKLRRAEHILCQKAKNALLLGGYMDFVPFLHFVFKCQDIPVERFRVTVLWNILA